MYEIKKGLLYFEQFLFDVLLNVERGYIVDGLELHEGFVFSKTLAISQKSQEVFSS